MYKNVYIQPHFTLNMLKVTEASKCDSSAHKQKSHCDHINIFTILYLLTDIFHIKILN